MTIEINEGNLKKGLLGLVVSLVEVIRDALETQALKRIDSGSLKDEEIERLGRALIEINVAIDEIKKDYELDESVSVLRDGLDDVAREAIKLMSFESISKQVVEMKRQELEVE